MKKLPILCTPAFILLFLTACKVNKNNTSSAATEKIILNEITVSGKPKAEAPYQPSAKRINDLLHMELHVRFDYAKQQVIGRAVLTVKPFLHPVTSLELDAKSFDIHRVALVANDTQDLKYTYTSDVLNIALGRAYREEETYKIFISYTAKPNESKERGSAAIMDAKGIYFINPMREEAGKPRQIWTQGETQSSSGWFPTIDRPNEKLTHDIYITAEEGDVTLSNGELMYSRHNNDNTHTDLWRQRLPHAPYLVMLAVGNFSVTTDHWRDSVEVSYYLEPDYHPHARLIFGQTPRMLECFSQRLGVSYPWDKFSQIVVRDFVSGAMENTSAVVHFESVQHDTREHLDNTWEDIISHELFHHWFGDLVTCESWSNIPLNESFATYGTYLWDEWSKGRMHADYAFDDNLKAYLGQKNKRDVKPIRYHYSSREDMFDVVSYQKGSRILHMLRMYLGDEAFFRSLKHYLNQHRFGTVEVHDLRLAFEKVCGEDLNWFFDQWFLRGGHPMLDIAESFTPDRRSVTLTVKQTQDSSSGLYRLPVAVDLYTGNGVVRKSWDILPARSQSVTFTCEAPILFANADAEKMLLATVGNDKTLREYAGMLERAPLYMDKDDAAEGIVSHLGDTAPAYVLQAVRYALNHPFHGVRSLGLDIAYKLSPHQFALFSDDILRMASADSASDVRKDAIELLASLENEKYRGVFMNGLKDSSYAVAAASLKALHNMDAPAALREGAMFANSRNAYIQSAYAGMVSEDHKGDHVAYFERVLGKFGLYRFGVLNSYLTYLRKADTAIVIRALPGLKSYYERIKGKDGYSQVILQAGILDMLNEYRDDANDLMAERDKLKPGHPGRAAYDAKIAAALSMAEKLERLGIAYGYSAE